MCHTIIEAAVSGAVGCMTKLRSMINHSWDSSNWAPGFAARTKACTGDTSDLRQISDNNADSLVNGKLIFLLCSGKPPRAHAVSVDLQQ